ncbi:hypothetical protein SAMN04487914_111103 [Arthrobacter sp. ok909]|nr:hypothetical protein SAMN04487914_111103 [Arthrobacter sp. ok909]
MPHRPQSDAVADIQLTSVRGIPQADAEKGLSNADVVFHGWIDIDVIDAISEVAARLG